MKKSISKQKTKRKKVRFSCVAVEANDVHLVGEFNAWKAGAHPMRNDGKGVWVKHLFLPEGRFEYKFLVDNRWVADPQNERSCPNCFGSENSIVVVTV